MSEFSKPISVAEAPVDSSPTISYDKALPKEVMPESVLNYETFHNRPYTADYFQLLEYRDVYGKPQRDVFGIMPRISDIEEYVKNSIEERGLEDTAETYKFLIDEILSQIGDNPTEDIRHRFERVSVYAKNNKDVKRQITINSLRTQLAEAKKKEKELLKMYGNK